jgi:hypothetical protein
MQCTASKVDSRVTELKKIEGELPRSGKGVRGKRVAGLWVGLSIFI